MLLCGRTLLVVRSPQVFCPQKLGQRAQHLSSLWTPGKISATPFGQTSRSSCKRASQVSTSSACQFPRSAGSTHDPNRTGKSEVMVRVSPSREDSVRECRNFKGNLRNSCSLAFWWITFHFGQLDSLDTSNSVVAPTVVDGNQLRISQCKRTIWKRCES